MADTALQDLIGRGLEDFLSTESGNHHAPASPLVTTLINILHADLWRQWGYAPTFALGHSIGEVAAAYVAGLFSTKEVLELAHHLGRVAAELPGAMLHTVVPAARLSDFPHKELHLAAVNCVLPDSTDVSVSLCGSERHATEWLAADEGATKLMPAHPWHHPLYRTTAAFGAFSAGFRPPKAYATSTCHFVSATKVALLTSVDASHWESWLTAPVQFAAALDLVAQRARGAPLCALQTGPHAVLDGAVAALGATVGVKLLAQAASLCRNAPALAFIRQQRAALATASALAPALRAALSRPGALQAAVGDSILDPDRHPPHLHCACYT